MPAQRNYGRIFDCSVCAHHGGWRLSDGRFECSGCGKRSSVTAGTIFDRTQTPLTVWFAACWQFVGGKDGISALRLKRTLEIGSYQNPFRASGSKRRRPPRLGGPGPRGEHGGHLDPSTQRSPSCHALARPRSGGHRCHGRGVDPPAAGPPISMDGAPSCSTVREGQVILKARAGFTYAEIARSLECSERPCGRAGTGPTGLGRSR